MATGRVVRVAKWLLVRVACTCHIALAARSLDTNVRSSLPCVAEAHMRNVLEQHSQVTGHFVGWER